MVNSIGNLPQSLESIEQMVMGMKKVMAGARVQESAKNDAKALVEGLATGLEEICTSIIANSERMKLDTLTNSYNKIGKIFTAMKDVGDSLSVETKMVAEQVKMLSFIIKNKGKA